MSQFDLPSDFILESLKIDGNDAKGLFHSISVYENIFSPIITGSVTIGETDFASFIEKYKIEGNEKFEFQTKVEGSEYMFEGKLNGLRNKENDQQLTYYTFDFVSKEMEKNEQTFITKPWKKKQPKEIIEEMIKEMDGKQEKIQGSGKPMTFLSSRKRPWEVIKFVLKHGVPQDVTATEGDKEKRDEETKGVGGFFCWQTADGFRFETIEKTMKGQAGTNAGDFKYQTNNDGKSNSELMKSIVHYDFKMMGDIQAKLRSGGFRNTLVVMDLDRLHYKEYTYDNEKMMTNKQKEVSTKPSRYICINKNNERWENKPDKAKNSEYDQSTYYLASNIGGENTFDDSQGTITFYPQLKMRAGDTVKCMIYKTQSSGGSNTYDKKHSGQYVVQEVAHHFLALHNKAYTKASVLRTTKQQDDASSTS